MDTGNYTKFYSANKLVEKVGTVGSGGIIRTVTTLFVLLQQSSTPIWVRATIVGALGYFICPFDLVPDFLPAGLADDLVVVTTTLSNLYMYKNKETATEAHTVMVWVFFRLGEGYMKIIPSLAALETLEDKDLVQFIRNQSLWLEEHEYNSEELGYTFILSGISDAFLHQHLCLVPHAGFDDPYRQQMTIDLSVFDSWEYATRDTVTGYYQAVLVISSNGYGANLIMSAEFVRSIKGLQDRLHQLLEFTA